MSTPNRRFARSSATSTCIWLIPERISSPVCWSRRRRSVGSSSARRRIAVATFSSSPFDLGVIAKLMTGSGNPKSGTSIATSLSASRSPVCASLSLATEPRSPSPKSSAAWCSLPCTSRSVPMRSLPFERRLTSVVSAVTVPLSTRKRLMRPANGSATVLKTNAAIAAPSTSIGEPFFAGEGTPSTRRSSSACVPRFFVATPHATGKTSPLVIAALSAAATSCASSSCPSR